MASEGVKRRVQAMARRSFGFWESLGVHVMPVSYDSPIRETAKLTDALFEREYSCTGLDWNEAVQLDHLRTIFPRYIGERDFPSNAGLSRADAAAAYAMVRHRKPKRIVEAGGGLSTTFLGSACARNAAEGSPCEYVAYEPYPSDLLRAGVEGLSALHQQPIEEAPLDAFDGCDLLFIDSTHVASIGSDVTHLLLEVIPRLPVGALVHFHDILLPAEYWKEWVVERRHFWNEQQFVLAFLLHNDSFQVRWAAHFMQLRHPTELASNLPMFDAASHRLSSLWIERTA